MQKSSRRVREDLASAQFPEGWFLADLEPGRAPGPEMLENCEVRLKAAVDQHLRDIQASRAVSWARWCQDQFQGSGAAICKWIRAKPHESLPEISVPDMRRALRKASGPGRGVDGWTRAELQVLPDTGLAILAKIFAAAELDGGFPSCGGLGTVEVLLDKGAGTAATQQRNIGILPRLGKYWRYKSSKCPGDLWGDALQLNSRDERAKEQCLSRWRCAASTHGLELDWLPHALEKKDDVWFCRTCGRYSSSGPGKLSWQCRGYADAGG